MASGRKIRVKALIPWITVIAVVLIVIGGILIYEKVKTLPAVRLVQRGDELYCRKTGVTYTPAGENYEPVLVVREPLYAECGGRNYYMIGSKNGENKVVRADAESYIASYEGDFSGRIYYNADKETLPSLAEFEVEKIYLCTNDGVIIAKNVLRAGEAQIVTENYLGDEEAVLPRVSSEYTLLFVSSKYSWMYIRMSLYYCTDGNYYIRDAAGEKTVRAYHSIFDNYFEENEEA